MRNLLNQTITHSSKSSFDAYGKEVVGSGTNYLARVELVTKTKFLPNGQTMIIDALAFVADTSSIEIDDKIVHSSVSYKVIGKNVVTDGQGNTHHIELQLQKYNI